MDCGSSLTYINHSPTATCVEERGFDSLQKHVAGYRRDFLDVFLFMLTWDCIGLMHLTLLTPFKSLITVPLQVEISWFVLASQYLVFDSQKNHWNDQFNGIDRLLASHVLILASTMWTRVHVLANTLRYTPPQTSLLPRPN